MNVAGAFSRFPDEAVLIGRILGGYTDLEVDLMNCVRTARQDLDTVLKAMFRNRGESARLKVADAFGRQTYRSLGLGAQFEAAIGAMRYCMGIRNQYAHCVWWDDNTGQLTFANLEELADLNQVVNDLRGLTTHHLDVSLLQKQFAYFDYTSDFLMWLLQEAEKLSNRPHIPNIQQPVAQQPPPKYL